MGNKRKRDDEAGQGGDTKRGKKKSKRSEPKEKGTRPSKNKDKYKPKSEMRRLAAEALEGNANYIPLKAPTTNGSTADAPPRPAPPPAASDEVNGKQEKKQDGDKEKEKDKTAKHAKKEAKRERDRMEKKERREKKKEKKRLLQERKKARKAEVHAKKYGPKPKPGEEGYEEDHKEEEEEEQEEPVTTEEAGQLQEELTTAANGESNENAEEGESEQKSAHRFICFIGNLPFTATLESVTQHFSKITPTQIRVPMEKTGKKGRGFGFVEFDNYDRMKTCLKLYHHSSFDDGVSPARKINVELTAGGGGSKSETRKARIEEKNKKLNEERAKAAKDADKKKKKAEKKQEGAKMEDAGNGEAAEPAFGDIHPSRMNRFNK